jgi:cholesterol transport system auxiliary component
MPALRLGRVTASSHLGERVVYRDSSHEIGYYEDRRWSERPDVYLRRALSRRLFEQKGMRRLVAGAGPTLDVELIDFEELRGTSPTARVRASFILQDGRAVLREQTIVVERAIAVEKQPTAEQMVVALSAALDELVERMTTSVQAGLEQPASANEKAPTIK